MDASGRYVSGTVSFVVRLHPPQDVSVVQRLEVIERELMDLTGSLPASALRELWDASSEYEQALLRLIATNEEVGVSEVLREYANQGLDHSSGRILAGVASGITKKMRKLGIPDL